MIMVEQQQAQDTKYFNQPKTQANKHKDGWLPKASLPNGKRPDFGNGNKKKQPHQVQHQHLPQASKNKSVRQSLPNGEKPDFGNSYKTNSSEHNLTENQINNKAKSKKHNNKSKKPSSSPLSSPQFANSVPNSASSNYSFHSSSPIPTPPSNPQGQPPSSSRLGTPFDDSSLSGSRKSMAPSSAPMTSSSSKTLNANYAGASFTNSPETSSLPKPSFL